MSPVSALSQVANQLAGPGAQQTALLEQQQGFPDRSIFSLQAALTRALDLISRQQQQIVTLEAEAQTDSLTGVLNHRGFHKALSREVDRANRSGAVSAILVLFDLDGLKRVNDRYGHAAGDAYIRALAAGLHSVRTTDYIGRLGGDEFGLLLTDTCPDAAMSRIERLVQHLNGSRVAHADQSFNLSVSHGTATIAPGSKAPQLLATADSALYRLKAERNASY